MLKTNSHSTRGDGILENFLSDLRAKRANQLISDNQRDGKILDIGCGSYPNFLSSVDFKEKYGIDPSLSTNDFENINLKKMNISNQPLPFDNNFFNVVTMLAVFEHIEKSEISSILNEIRRVLVKDGSFIMTTPAPWADGLLHSMARINLISNEEIHEHKSHYGMNTIRKMITDSGFDDKLIRSGYFELGMNMWFKIKK